MSAEEIRFLTIFCVVGYTFNIIFTYISVLMVKCSSLTEKEKEKASNMIVEKYTFIGAIIVTLLKSAIPFMGFFVFSFNYFKYKLKSDKEFGEYLREEYRL